ncbi:autotransporter outer membrane beta-barrel domain-containing protein [Comamonas koreensis]|nr:autotransporter outer membrane beta-barrel domain-containing protein [Comamonas koreensis]
MPWMIYHTTEIKTKMKTPKLSRSAYASLICCFMAAAAHAQSIILTGDTTPTGDLGASYQGTVIMVGNTGSGTLDIFQGGNLSNSQAGVLGAAAGASGTASLSGTSLWSPQQLVVGQNGTGVLNILSGSRVNAADMYIGLEAGSTGTVTLDGAGSSVELAPGVENGLLIGNNQGSGTLRVLNGAQLLARNSLHTATGTPGSKALIRIDGPGSSINVTNECNLGMTGESLMEITNGGSLQCQATQMGFGLVLMDGSGSRLHVANNSLAIGTSAPHSDAVLSVDEGSSLVVDGGIHLPLVSGDTSSSSRGELTIGGNIIPGNLQADIFFGENGLGVLNIAQNFTTGGYRFSQTIIGRGTVNIFNGTTTFAREYDYEGSTNVKSGTLRAGHDNSFSRNSDFTVDNNGTLDTDTFNPTTGSLSVTGFVTMQSGGTSNVLTVAGNYTSNGGALAMNTVLGADDSASQKLVVNGDTSGTTTLHINNLGGLGAPTTGNGILVVEVAGASNGVFSLLEPGYLEVGEFRYFLTQVGNHWYLQTRTRDGVSTPEVSIACTPTQLSDADNQVATCTVTLAAAQETDLPINLNLPTDSPRYTSTCTTPLVVAANSSSATCTITAVPNTTPNDGNVTAQLSVAPPTVPDAYVAAGAPAQVVIMDADTTRPPTNRPAIPTVGPLGLALMGVLIGIMGLVRCRKHRSR